MAAFMLESLVLRGVLVLRDELAVGLRLDTGVEVNPQTPGIRNSRRHPAPNCRKPDMQPAAGPDVGYPTSGVKPGAGRSRRQLGSPMRPGAARTTRRTALWRTTFGGQTSTVVSSSRAISAGLVASVSEETILHLAARQSEKHSVENRFPGEAFAKLPVKPCWRKPAGPTPPVSMRENEGR
jgi:hypothetical protein